MSNRDQHEYENEFEDDAIELENGEQIDELSKGTLGSYVKKAGRSREKLSAEHERLSSAYDGVPAAMGRSREVNDLGGKMRSAISKDMDKTRHKLANRGEGTHRAIKQLTKEEHLDETLAANSLRPHGAPGESMSKIEMMKGIIGAAAGMEKSDLINFFNQVQSQFGPGKDYGVGDKSGSNEASIKMHPSDAGAPGANVKMPMPTLSVKEDVANLFEGQDLSEEFKERVSDLFDAAIHARVVVETARLEEEYEQVINEQFAAINEELTQKIDTYLDYVVENWMRENEVAIESSLRNELMDDFVDGLRGLFAEHYIEMPEERVDVVESLTEKITDLEHRLDEMVNVNVELKDVVNEGYRNQLFEEISCDLTLTQKEKFSSLVEGLEFDGDLEIFKTKLLIIKENYFKAGEVVEYDSNFETETFEGDINESVSTNVDPSVNRYVQAIARTVKR